MYKRKLIDYLPAFERNIKELDAIMTKAEDPEMFLGWEEIDNAFADQLILDATEHGVSRMEKIMKVIPKATETLDERKFSLLVKENEQPPFTIEALKSKLESLCGEGNYSLNRDVANKVIYVAIALVARNSFDDVKTFLERIVPANMVIELTLKYNRHEFFMSNTHEQMQTFTHERLRNEVF